MIGISIGFVIGIFTFLIMQSAGAYVTTRNPEIYTYPTGNENGCEVLLNWMGGTQPTDEYYLADFSYSQIGGHYFQWKYSLVFENKEKALNFVDDMIGEKIGSVRFLLWKKDIEIENNYFP